MKDAKIMAATSIGVLVCNFTLFCTDMIMTGNPGLWLAIHAAEDLYMAWLMKNLVEARKKTKQSCRCIPTNKTY